MGKRKVINEENLENMLFPSKNDVLGMAVKMLGSTESWSSVKMARNDYAESEAS